MEMNDRGIYFPVLGLCFGIQFMGSLTFDPPIDPSSMCTGVKHKLLPLNFTAAARKSKQFQNMPEDLYNSLATDNITGHFHGFGIAMKIYNSFSQLQQNFTVTSTNHDNSGMEFISTMESKHYPFYGIQWHPEKAFFMHSLAQANILNQPRSAYKMSRWFSKFLREEASKNNNSFLSMAEQERFAYDRYETKKRFTESYHVSVKKLSFANFELPAFDEIE